MSVAPILPGHSHRVVEDEADLLSREQARLANDRQIQPHGRHCACKPCRPLRLLPHWEGRR